MAVAVMVAGCGTQPPSDIEAGTSTSSGPAEGSPDDGGREAEVLGGVTEPWELTGTSPDGRLLTLATSGGGCSTFQGWITDEDADRVHVEARWEHTGDEVCDAILRGDRFTLRLAQPLGDRHLSGCERDDCLAQPDEHESFGPANQVSVADDALVVTGQVATWSIDPADGAVRWERPRDGYWSHAIDGRVLRYDHVDHIEMLDAVTGETIWDAEEVTLAGIDGDEVVVCPREQALDDGPRETFRGALSLHDGSWSWRDDGASCTTDSVSQEDPAVPDVDLAPDVIGRSAALDLATHDGIVFVATSTAIVAVDPDSGSRLWWTLLAAPDVVEAGQTHRPTPAPT